MRASFLALIAIAGCAAPSPLPPPPAGPPPLTPPARLAPPPDEPVPALRLPADTRPLAQALELRLDPRKERYTGSVDIDLALDAARSTLWMHGKDLEVTKVTVAPQAGAPIDGTWKQRNESGVASVTLARPVPPGKARVHLEFGAAFGRGGHGLYRAREADVDYAFTQFEAIAARQAFPCLDEPGFKIPFATTLVIPSDLQVVANTREASRTPDAAPGMIRVAFAPTLPLPSYLVAFAVGPFDVVAAPDVPPNAVRTRPLQLRGITAKGRGKEIAYALAHTGEILAALEGYVGLEYAYDKLDILAVPGKGGAMENPGAITFGEQLLLMDEKSASVGQLRGYAGVMAHELAHQWTGDLVTMAWWDDTWLNEAFASWLGPKAADAWNPAVHADLGMLRSASRAMSVDAQASARSIRQPIASTHDIENAFDSITYSKGAGVLSMFERWAGGDAWKKGLHDYLVAHRNGNGTADDFLAAESDATGKDVKTAFHTFLDQPGVPLVEASLECSPGARSRDGKAEVPPSARLHLRQSRFVPIGGTTDAAATWQIPVCARTDLGTACTLLAQPEATLDLPGAGRCPAYVMPNADGAGYYRFALPARDLDALRSKGLPALSERERLAYAASLRGAFNRGAASMKDVLAAALPLAKDAEPAIAEEPMAYLGLARSWLYADPLRARVEAYGRTVYAPIGQRLGWEPRAKEDDETRTLRSSVLGFLALTAQDPAVRAEARKRARALVKGGTLHPEAVDANLAGIALTVMGEEADRATWDTLHGLLLQSVDEVLRGRLVRAMASARDPELAKAARDLVLDPTLRDTEVLAPLYVQLDRDDTRDAAWAWLVEHYDAIVGRLPRHRAAMQLFGAAGAYCDDDHGKAVEAFFGPKAPDIEGGPRALATTLEGIHLCAAKRRVHEPGARELFGKK